MFKLLDYMEYSSDANAQAAYVNVPKIFQVDTNGTLTTNLISYYKLEDEKDSFASNDFVNNGSVPFSTGKVNNAASFSSGKYFNKSASSAFAFGTGAFSFFFWFKTTVDDTFQCIWDSRQGSETLDGIFIAIDINRKMVVSGNGVVIQGTTSVVKDTWNYAYVIGNGGANGSRTIKLYLNGTQEGSTLTVDYDMSSSKIVYMGVNYPSGTLIFYGQLDEFGIWNKIISSQEISDLYNGGSGQTMVLPGGAVAPLMKIFLWWL